MEVAFFVGSPQKIISDLPYFHPSCCSCSSRYPRAALAVSSEGANDSGRTAARPPPHSGSLPTPSNRAGRLEIEINREAAEHSSHPLANSRSRMRTVAPRVARRVQRPTKTPDLQGDREIGRSGALRGQIFGGLRYRPRARRVGARAPHTSARRRRGEQKTSRSHDSRSPNLPVRFPGTRHMLPGPPAARSASPAGATVWPGDEPACVESSAAPSRANISCSVPEQEMRPRRPPGTRVVPSPAPVPPRLPASLFSRARELGPGEPAAIWRPECAES
jgi:hypothetical protein